VLQGVIAWRVVSRIVTGDIPADMVTPALYLPPVGGGLIGALALNALGSHGWAVLLFGMGIGAWALLEARVLNRLFAGPVPPPLRPTLGVEIAPAPVATLVAAALWPELPADVLLIGLGISCGPLIAVLARWRWWTNVPFSAGFWSFSFPIAAFASVIVEAVRRGGWPMEVAYGAVLVATAVIGYLAVRTLVLLFRGRLLPPG
jgi:tellurite resistance protein